MSARCYQAYDVAHNTLITRDGVSIAASIVAVVDVSVKIITLCSQYSKAVANAGADIAHLETLVKGLKTTLGRAQALIEALQGASLSTSQDLPEQLAGCRSTLQNRWNCFPSDWYERRPHYGVLNAAQGCHVRGKSTHLRAISGLCILAPEVIKLRSRTSSLRADTHLLSTGLMPDPSIYNVGWICAIKPEYVAAQAFLDEKHDRQDHGSNIYTLGRLGKHNVVIGTLPDGEYGIGAAASVANGMLSSFPNVRIGLMVGIGGAAPSDKNDIRLGDIVVSASRHGHGGVFQYDFGKTIQNNKFQTVGFLNQPPELLRAALTDIQAEYEMEGHRLKEAIDTALNQRPRLRQNYQRPSDSSDILFKSGIIHREIDGADCATVCSDGPSSLVNRRKRAKEEDNPAIHYGTIASANQLIKDAFVRDRLAAEKNVLCFEMEAAGLMNRFPCVVIRGICDYADSHKNKQWQGYAAMAAAAGRFPVS
ncbi:hypothetical protein NLG97_g9783 [Lecanicillium saksenae]|uniref:Uncharacterized protein n=1 Tax=Lecanicillium saksenae TaxID=468837 RepID=A0ACC1QGJ0_9HYPO|nr:hypothetical protein NLG97_g9783 [Lecanicillium saksenae]